MAAAGLTKPLTNANFKVFVGITEIKDKKDLLAFIKKEGELRETLKQQKYGLKYSAAFDYKSDKNWDIGMWLLKQSLGMGLATLLSPMTELKWEQLSGIFPPLFANMYQNRKSVIKPKSD